MNSCIGSATRKISICIVRQDNAVYSKALFVRDNNALLRIKTFAARLSLLFPDSIIKTGFILHTHLAHIDTYVLTDRLPGAIFEDALRCWFKDFLRNTQTLLVRSQVAQAREMSLRIHSVLRLCNSRKRKKKSSGTKNHLNCHKSA